ncbi:MAG: LytTR family transcriptional regulator DNA-binding domain-containing protein [Solibacillus sp.]
MIIDEVFQKGKIFVPKIELTVQLQEIIGIQTNVQRKKVLLEALKTEGSSYIFTGNTGEYERHTVKELLKFILAITDSTYKVDLLIEKFDLGDIQNIKIKDLPYSRQMFIKLLRVYFAPQSTIVLEEPYFYLDDAERKITHELLLELSSTKKLIVLTSNLEDALISCHKIYRLDSEGLRQLDIVDSDVPKETTEEQLNFKIEKISTKKNEKVILFDPPEIDYIESLEGSVLIHVGGENYSCAMTLIELEKKLKSYGFFRCHRSYIVNLQKVREIITWTKNSYSLRLNLGKDSVVPLSRAKLQELRDLLNL